MAHSKQALKRNRQALKKRLHNREIKSEIKTGIRKYRETLVKGGDVSKLMPALESRIDRAAKSKVIPTGRANRIKARLRKAAARTAKPKA
jgi:small subunit ribosomal protein S20